MTVYVFFVVGAVVCTVSVTKYVWGEIKCFKAVYNDIRRELKQR